MVKPTPEQAINNAKASVHIGKHWSRLTAAIFLPVIWLVVLFLALYSYGVVLAEANQEESGRLEINPSQITLVLERDTYTYTIRLEQQLTETQVLTVNVRYDENWEWLEDINPKQVTFDQGNWADRKTIAITVIDGTLKGEAITETISHQIQRDEDEKSFPDQGIITIIYEPPPPQFSLELYADGEAGSGQATLEIDVIWESGFRLDEILLEINLPAGLAIIEYPEEPSWEKVDEDSWRLPTSDLGREETLSFNALLTVTEEYTGEPISARLVDPVDGEQEWAEATFLEESFKDLLVAAIAPTPTNTPEPTEAVQIIETPALEPTEPEADQEEELNDDIGMLASLVQELATLWEERDTRLLILGAAFIIVLLFLAVTILWALYKSRRPTAPPPPITITEPPPPPPAAPAVPTLLLADDRARRFVITAPRFTIGRAEENDLLIDETFSGWETVSRRHAIIQQVGEQIIIEDQNSRNGIRVNGRATAKNLLRDGWTVAIGRVEFIFTVHPDATPERGGS